MTIAFKQGSVFTEIGPGGILHSLCSTIAMHLEGGDWGSRFPALMNELYQGQLVSKHVDGAQRELAEIKRGLQTLPPSKVVWDIEDPNTRPKWTEDVGPHVKSMADFFVTTSGRNLLDELADNLESLKEFGGTLDVVSYDGAPKS
jgi:2,3-bisphosphoglycerate-dependent phosphoglycerate mutase